MLKCVLFDLDGTLTDSSEGIFNGFRHALAKMGRKEPPAEKLRLVMGPPLHYSFEEIFGMTPEDAEKAVAFYREFYVETGIFQNKMYEGARKMLENLKKSGKILAIVTSRAEFLTRKIISNFDIEKYFSFISASSLHGAIGEKEALVAAAMREFPDVKRSEFCMVGDRMYDIEGGKLNGISTVGVTYGAGTMEELVNAGADFLAHSPAEVEKILLENFPAENKISR